MKDSKVFLKCVKTYSSYLTEGKVYPATLESDGDGYYLTTDSDATAYQWQLTGSHADFELVQENEENSMTSVLTLTPESLGCFQQVADVIGVESAREELQRVIDYHGNNFDSPFGPENELDACFEWAETRQGDCFWGTISNGEIPEGFTPKSQLRSQELSEPKFGDLLNGNGVCYVFIRVDNNGDCMVIDDKGNFVFASLDFFDEYKPDPAQELRNRILARWQSKTLDSAFDTEVCIVEMRMGDLINFVIENLNHEFADN